MTNFSSFFISLFIWLHQIFSCSIWDLVPWTGIEPGPPPLGAQSLSHLTTREVPSSFLGIESAQQSFPSRFYSLILQVKCLQETGNWFPLRSETECLEEIRVEREFTVLPCCVSFEFYQMDLFPKKSWKKCLNKSWYLWRNKPLKELWESVSVSRHLHCSGLYRVYWLLWSYSW